MNPRTLVEKVWDDHVIGSFEDGPDILFIDLHVVHEMTSFPAFDEIDARGLSVPHPELTLATADHIVPTARDRVDSIAGRPRHLVERLAENCRRHQIDFHGLDSEMQGIVHVIAGEQGRVQPGMTVVCGDSHTSTLGAFGAVAFGIGTTGVLHVLASQTLLVDRPDVMEIDCIGELPPQVTSKDLMLHIAMTEGTAVGTGHAIEYRGSAIERLSMEARMSLCNMSIEIGGRCGVVGPDETTADYLIERLGLSPSEADRRSSVWASYRTEADARFARTVKVNASEVRPMISFGTTPSMSMPIDDVVPEFSDSRPESQEQYSRGLEYMGFAEGESLLGKPVDAVFIGSCTNSRIEDLRAAAEVIRGHKVASSVRVLIVPGSVAVQRQAESEGLADAFREAGAEWGEPSCSMCVAINGDILQPGEYAVSTSNRNFEGRQGTGGRTLLASPKTAAATALNGTIMDPRLVTA